MKTLQSGWSVAAAGRWMCLHRLALPRWKNPTAMRDGAPRLYIQLSGMQDALFLRSHVQSAVREAIQHASAHRDNADSA